MLGQILTKQFTKVQFKTFTSIPKFSFGSGHHDYSVNIDKDATWIRYRTSRRLASVQGIEDVHYQMPDPDNSDPFVHLKQNSKFSLQNLAYNDPYYHEDEHEALVNEPHGYVNGNDPLDSRYDILIPNVLTFLTFTSVLVLMLYLQCIPYREAELYREKLAIEEVENSLSSKNEELNSLKDRIKELLGKEN